MTIVEPIKKGKCVCCGDPNSYFNPLYCDTCMREHKSVTWCPKRGMIFSR